MAWQTKTWIGIISAISPKIKFDTTWQNNTMSLQINIYKTLGGYFYMDAVDKHSLWILRPYSGNLRKTGSWCAHFLTHKRACQTSCFTFEGKQVHLVLSTAAACVKFSWFMHVSRHNPHLRPDFMEQWKKRDARTSGRRAGWTNRGREELPDRLSIYYMTRQWYNVELPYYHGIDPPATWHPHNLQDGRGGSLPYGWWSANRWYVSYASTDPRWVGRRQRRMLSAKRRKGWPVWATVRRCCALPAISMRTSVWLSQGTKKA